MDLHERVAGAAGFDWDAGNAEKNWLKHEVHPTECEQVFFNRPLVVAPDVAHSGEEVRIYALGQTNRGRLLFLAFTLRGDRIRVISARDMSRKEREAYASHA
jgi:uncharacterized DUF497 family protein